MTNQLHSKKIKNKHNKKTSNIKILFSIQKIVNKMKEVQILINLFNYSE